jgi:hypothetical protein
LWHFSELRADRDYKNTQMIGLRASCGGITFRPVDGGTRMAFLARRQFSSRSRSAFPQGGVGDPNAALRKQRGRGARRWATTAKATSQAEPVS